jgi:hypothetical protein
MHEFRLLRGTSAGPFKNAALQFADGQGVVDDKNAAAHGWGTFDVRLWFSGPARLSAAA